MNQPSGKLLHHTPGKVLEDLHRAEVETVRAPWSLVRLLVG